MLVWGLNSGFMGIISRLVVKIFSLGAEIFGGVEGGKRGVGFKMMSFGSKSVVWG